MSESRTTCNLCGRQPGERHRDECPYSRSSLRALDEHVAARDAGTNFVCPPKGVPVVSSDGRVLVNPGIPYVLKGTRSGKKTHRTGGRPWFAGGIPAFLRGTPLLRDVVNGLQPPSALLGEVELPRSPSKAMIEEAAREAGLEVATS